ncbi:flagellar biosynthetic protein FliO [Arthrobacter sp. MYb227]|uniref:FliO/MopB family protein n=1 Tax=Arthrobacter sp. MYb227 TaxID=1848601 RepID=UPI0015E410B7|nr:flagellar biosynthetic protein FliO [Arthrobacter sp. MYb227]
MENFFLLLRVIISLAAVLGLLFYLRKRILPRFGTQQTNRVNVVERQSIGPKSAVVLLDVQGRRYLLGVGESSINVLDSFEAPEPLVLDPVAGQDQDGSAEQRSRSFAATLQKLTGAAPTETGNHGEPSSLAATSPLAGSILSAQTWRNAWTALKTGRSL